MQDNVESDNKTKNIKVMPEHVSIICFLIVGMMAWIPFLNYLLSDNLRFLLAKTFMFAILFVIVLIGFLRFLIKKKYLKSIVLFFCLLLVSYGELDTYVSMQMSVPESYYKDMTAILKHKKTPISIKQYLYNASRDGIISYKEWLIFDTRYSLYLSTHKEDIDIDQKEQGNFLSARETIMM